MVVNSCFLAASLIARRSLHKETVGHEITKNIFPEVFCRDRWGVSGDCGAGARWTTLDLPQHRHRNSAIAAVDEFRLEPHRARNLQRKSSGDGHALTVNCEYAGIGAHGNSPARHALCAAANGDSQGAVGEAGVAYARQSKRRPGGLRLRLSGGEL